MILVTGTNGYIGSRVREYLGAIGTTIDIRNKEAMRPLIMSAEFVVNCAGKKYDCTREEFFSVNVEGTRNVAELCKEYGTKLIHLGSIITKGDYGESKAESERLVRDMEGLNAVVLRLCVIDDIGKGKWHYPILKLLKDIRGIIDDHDFSKYTLIKYPK